MCLRGPGYSWGREYPHLLSRHFALSRELFTATVRRWSAPRTTHTHVTQWSAPPPGARWDCSTPRVTDESLTMLPTSPARLEN